MESDRGASLQSVMEDCRVDFSSTPMCSLREVEVDEEMKTSSQKGACMYLSLSVQV